jgi:hypothetical protein
MVSGAVPVPGVTVVVSLPGPGPSGPGGLIGSQPINATAANSINAAKILFSFIVVSFYLLIIIYCAF